MGLMSPSRAHPLTSAQRAKFRLATSKSHPSGIDVAAGPSLSALPETTPENASVEVLRVLQFPSVRAVLLELPKGMRRRTLTLLPVVVSLLWLVARRLPSFGAVLDLLRQGRLPGVGALDVTSSAFTQRLQALPHDLMLGVLKASSHALAQTYGVRRAWIQAWVPWASGVFAVDDTTLDALARKVPELMLHAKGKAATLGGRLACALNLSTGTWAEILYDSDSAANEKSHVRALLQRLGMEALVVLDLGYYSFELFDWMTRSYLWFVTRLREGAAYRVLQVFKDEPLVRDRLVLLGGGKNRAGYPLRLVELYINGSWHGYLTNQLQVALLGPEVIWALYEQRWSIEMAFFALKRILGLASLRACHINGVLWQVWASLLVYQVLQHLRLTVAVAAGWQEDEVSWEMLMRRVPWYIEDASDEALEAWLTRQAATLLLKKRGVRARRKDSITAEHRRPCELPSAPLDLPLLETRPARNDGNYGRTAPCRWEMAGLAGMGVAAPKS